MSGRNQHHIPQFFQRGFAIPCSGKPKEIWLYEGGHLPVISQIKSTAAGFDFYSPPSTGGVASLDDEITTRETPLSEMLSAFRALPFGRLVDPAQSARILCHLAPRSSHLRDLVERGFRSLASGAKETFTNVDVVEHYLGLDSDFPSEAFENAMESIRESPQFKVLRLPESVLEEIVFVLAKEMFRTTFEQGRQGIENQLESFGLASGEFVRDGHNKALGQMIDSSVRQEGLESFSWSIESGPEEGLILPDCIAVGFLREGGASPYMTAAHDELAAIVMPLSSSRVLLGRKLEADPPDLKEINRISAGCSTQFFLAASDRPEYAALAAIIGTISTSMIDEAVSGALQKYRIDRDDERSNSGVESSTEERGIETSARPVPQGFGYEVTFYDCAGDDTASRISERLKNITSGFCRSFPLSRLDGITFAPDCFAALQELDRGTVSSEDLNSPADTEQELILSALVERNGVFKVRVILNSAIGIALISEEQDGLRKALQILIYELALVALFEYFDVAFPGGLAGPSNDDDAMNFYLYRSMEPALAAYFAARVTDSFVTDNATVPSMRALSISAIEGAQRVIPAATREYLLHSDGDKLLHTVTPAIREILRTLGGLLGRCAAQGESALDEAGLLAATLNRSAIEQWLDTYRVDLENFWDRLGEWRSFDEFRSFSRHLKRLLWAFQIFPWQTPDGPWRVEVRGGYSGAMQEPPVEPPTPGKAG